MKPLRFVAGVIVLASFGALLLSGCSSDCGQVAEERDQLKKDVEALSATVAVQASAMESMREAHESLLARFASEIESNDLRIQLLVDGVELVLPSDVLYESGSARATMSGSGRETAEDIAEFLANTDYFVSVIGHTDNEAPSAELADTYATNWDLAGARAVNAVKFLCDRGVDPTRITAVSRGEFDPVASNDTPEGRAMNRRIQIILRDISK